MKYTPESFIIQNAKNKPSLKNLSGVLLYGFDEKLIQILEQEVCNLFEMRTIRLTQAELLSNLDILNPPIDMFASNTTNLVIIENATDALVKTLESAIIHVKLLIKGDLKSKSKLVKFAEDHKSWGSVSCYESHLGTAEALMTSHLGKVIPALLSLSTDAIELKNQINIQKIHQNNNLEQDLLLLSQNMPILAASLLENALFSPRTLDKRMFDELIEELSGVGLARLFTNHLLKFIELREKIEIFNLSHDSAIANMTPPLFFKLRPFYSKSIQSLNMNQCIQAVVIFQKVEKEIKSSNIHALQNFWGHLLTLSNTIAKKSAPYSLI